MIEELNEIEALRDEYKRRGRETFIQIATSAVNEHPTIGMLCWAQYTPYFNDGDECVFSVRDIYAYSKQVAAANKHNFMRELCFGEVDQEIEGLEEETDLKISGSLKTSPRLYARERRLDERYLW